MFIPDAVPESPSVPFLQSRTADDTECPIGEIIEKVIAQLENNHLTLQIRRQQLIDTSAERQNPIFASSTLEIRLKIMDDLISTNQRKIDALRDIVLYYPKQSVRIAPSEVIDLT